jgi:3-mercaptopropionate dioxygenase
MEPSGTCPDRVSVLTEAIMLRAYALAEFVREMQTVVEQTATVAEIIAKGSQCLRRAIANPKLLAPQYRRLSGVRPNHGTYNLYRGRGLFVSASVWGPGDHSDPHDHGTWGLIGVIENTIQETRYRVVGNDERGLPRIERVDARLMKSGDVAVLSPDTGEIHELDNFSQQPTVELHVYGANLVGLDRFFYDRTTGLARPFRSGKYDNC